MTVDRDDVEQALEIACGHDIGHDISSRRTASQANIDRLRQGVLRFLRDLPDDATIHEVKEAFDEH